MTEFRFTLDDVQAIGETFADTLTVEMTSDGLTREQVRAAFEAQMDEFEKMHQWRLPGGEPYPFPASDGPDGLVLRKAYDALEVIETRDPQQWRAKVMESIAFALTQVHVTT